MDNARSDATLATPFCKDGPSAVLAGTDLTFIPSRPYVRVHERGTIVLRAAGPWDISLPTNGKTAAVDSDRARR
jgi:hypothetical protein